MNCQTWNPQAQRSGKQAFKCLSTHYFSFFVPWKAVQILWFLQILCETHLKERDCTLANNKFWLHWSQGPWSVGKMKSLTAVLKPWFSMRITSVVFLRWWWKQGILIEPALPTSVDYSSFRRRTYSLALWLSNPSGRQFPSYTAAVSHLQ